MENRALRRVTVRYSWDRLKVSFWFAPVVMSLAAILLVRVMNWVDAQIPNFLMLNSQIVLSASGDELRASLLAMSGTILATAGVVFTLLTLPLSTVAAQYGSRLLRLFLGDRTTQFVLGMFVGTFVYCLSAATSIPYPDVQLRAPQLLVTVGLLLMLLTFSSLILLVQHISTMLQAPQIAAAAGAELLDIVEFELPDKVGSIAEPTVQPVMSVLDEKDGYPVRARDAGYIQYIDLGYILTLASEKNLVIRLLQKPGHFVIRDEVISIVWRLEAGDSKSPPETLLEVNRRLGRQLHRAFRLGKQRTPTQDVEYAVNQLVEMAVRAMSPAINDPFTAMTCLDYLGQGLALFAGRGDEPPHILDRNGQLRMVFEPVPFDQLLGSAFDMLRHASCDNASVLLHILESLDMISQGINSPDRNRELLRHVNLVQSEAQAGALIEQDRQKIQRRAENLQTRFSAANIAQ